MLALVTVRTGLKKSCTPRVATPTAGWRLTSAAFSRTSIATAPAPWVYSPVEPSSYFAKSLATTIPMRPVPPRTQSAVLSSASTAPMHANVMSITSQRVKQSGPYSSR